MYCCKKIYRIKENVGTCEGDELDLKSIAQLDGEYTLICQFLGAEFSIKKTFVTGASLKFPTIGLNEKFEYTARLIDPAGAAVSFFDLADNTYDCISFQTIPKFTL